MATLIQLRRDTAANWTSVDPVLAAGEVGVEEDTGKHKIGDGATAWATLPYVVDPDLVAIGALDSSTAGTIASDGAGWVKKTYAQLKTALGLSKADVGLGNVSNLSPSGLAADPAFSATFGTAADGAALLSASTATANITLTFAANWGVNEQGNAYYDPGGAAPGEEAFAAFDSNGYLAITNINN